jgi:membrane-bound lytic murein transglycosylase D
MKKAGYLIIFSLGSIFLISSCTQSGYPGYRNTSEEGRKPDALTAHEKNSADSSDIDVEIALDRVNETPIEIIDSAANIEDHTVAVDDYIFRELSIAFEYYSMGVLANRETAWEEAEYYFEKAMSILGKLDIDVESDSLTLEAAKYNQLLADIITNYRVTLLSLGHLPEDVSPDALMARFSEINHFKIDSSEFKRLESYAQEKVAYDVPIILNERVKNCILYYQTVAREAFVKYLTRSTRFIPMIDSVFKEHGLPSDLKYLALVESGYNPRAYSWARAVGLWQFIASTGRLYKLNRNWWYDERRDPVKATDAAARFLKDLYEEFGSWELAMAAYNGGPARVRKSIRKQKTTDFWKLRLRKQTMDYVPFFMAATIISKDPEKFGFTDIDYQREWKYDEVLVDKCLDLKTVARAIGCHVTDLKDLNPELLREFSPPNVKKYRLRIPDGTDKKFWAAYEDMPSSKETSFVRHKIRRGETVSTIARKYGVSQYAIFETNNLNRRSKIYAGKYLIIPVPNDRSYTSARKNRSYEASGNVYVVRSGDTVWDIARAFGTTPDEIRRLNRLDRRARIYVGQKLRINADATPSKTYAGIEEDEVTFYIVRRGDSLWDIARRFGTTASELRSLNGLRRNSVIYPGQKLKVAGNIQAGDSFQTYTIRKGDTLWEIAAMFNTTVARIMAWNGVSNPRKIRVGDQLKIYTN